jgi:hypothetical protein
MLFALPLSVVNALARDLVVQFLEAENLTNYIIYLDFLLQQYITGTATCVHTTTLNVFPSQYAF